MLERSGNRVARTAADALEFACQVARDAPDLQLALQLAFHNEMEAPNDARAKMRGGRMLFEVSCAKALVAEVRAHEALSNLRSAAESDQSIYVEDARQIAADLDRATASLRQAIRKLYATASALPDAPERTARRGPERADALISTAVELLKRTCGANGELLTDRQIGLLFAAAGVGAFSPRSSGDALRRQVRNLLARR